MPIYYDRGYRLRSGVSGIMSGSSETHGQREHGHNENTRHQDWGYDAAARSEHFVPVVGRNLSSVDREELIQRVKRGQQAAIIAQPCAETPRVGSTIPSSPEIYATDASSRCRPDSQEKELFEAAKDIQRPRSALHAGDFREDAQSPPEPKPLRFDGFDTTSPPTPWFSSSSRIDFARRGPSFPPVANDVDMRHTRARAISQSSLSFVYRPPTSPLVYQSNNSDLDFNPRSPPIHPDQFSDRSRRHTFSPHSFQTYKSRSRSNSQDEPSPTKPLPSLRREGTFPCQAHQPRRSLSSSLSAYESFPPPVPPLRPRGPSISSGSPLQHAPLVGSYEESILRGRMSTTPSKPLSFIAQIGVLGRGQCKPSLRCPSHVSIPFPVVFYDYGGVQGRSSLSTSQPSPYVGMIDLESNLKRASQRSSSRRRRRRSSPPHSDNEDGGPGEADTGISASARNSAKRSRRSRSPHARAPPGGSYRVPAVGQMQIVIKNPNKTAVKLFLVPYDLSDMQPGTKTFIRQRSYSAGPIIDMPLSSRRNLGTDRPEASLGSVEDDPRDRPMLRYLVHLHFCCTGKGRYYLYKAVRVVFANRVPDGKEKLRVECQMPEPRYSMYRPSGAPVGVVGTPAGQRTPAETRVFWPNSAALHETRKFLSLDAMDGLAGFGRGYDRTAPAPSTAVTTTLPDTLLFHHRFSMRSIDDNLFSRDEINPGTHDQIMSGLGPHAGHDVSPTRQALHVSGTSPFSILTEHQVYRARTDNWMRVFEPTAGEAGSSNPTSTGSANGEGWVDGMSMGRSTCGRGLLTQKLRELGVQKDHDGSRDRRIQEGTLESGLHSRRE